MRVRIEKIVLFIVLFAAGCSQGVSLFRPRISCRYSADYGVILVSKDTVNKNFRISYVSYLDSDTSGFNVSSYLSSTLILLKGYSGIGYMDSSNILHLTDFSGASLMTIQLAWPLRMLIYDNESSQLWGITSDSLPRLINFNLPNMSTNFSINLSGYEVDSSIYFLDAVNKIYYFGAKNNDTLWLLGVSASAQKIVLKNVLSKQYLGIKYNYWSNKAIGLSADGQTYKIDIFNPQDMTKSGQSVISEQGLLPKIMSFDYAGQNLVIAQITDSTFNLLYVNPTNAQVTEVHKFSVNNVLELLAWSSMPY